MGAETVVINGPEVSKLASIASHLALRQRLYATVQHHDENHSLIDCFMATCRITCPDKANVLVRTGLWFSMEDLQTFILKLGMKEAIYKEAFKSPDLVEHSARMGDLILQQAPSHQYGMLVSIMNSLASEAIVQQTTQLVVNLGEMGHLRARHNIRMEEGTEVFPVIRTRKPIPQAPRLGPIWVS